MIPAKVKDLRHVCQTDTALQINARQPQHSRFRNDLQVTGNGWLLFWLFLLLGCFICTIRCCTARTAIVLVLTHTQIDTSIQDASTFGKIHSQKENIRPTTMGQIHAHWSFFPNNGIATTTSCSSSSRGRKKYGLSSHTSHGCRCIIVYTQT